MTIENERIQQEIAEIKWDMVVADEKYFCLEVTTEKEYQTESRNLEKRLDYVEAVFDKYYT